MSLKRNENKNEGCSQEIPCGLTRKSDALSCASRGTPLHIQRLKNVRINFLYAFHRAKRSDLSNFDFAVVLDRVHLFDVFRLIMAAFAK